MQCFLSVICFFFFKLTSSVMFFFFFKQKTAYEIETGLEFRRVLFRSGAEFGDSGLVGTGPDAVLGSAERGRQVRLGWPDLRGRRGLRGLRSWRGLRGWRDQVGRLGTLWLLVGRGHGSHHGGTPRRAGAPSAASIDMSLDLAPQSRQVGQRIDSKS